MDSTEVIFACRALDIELSVTESNTILARPASRLTAELREEIKANRDQLLYDLLMADALRYLAGRYVEGAEISVLDAHEDAINDAYLRDWSAYRQAIRSYVKAGLAEFERARRRVEPIRG